MQYLLTYVLTYFRKIIWHISDSSLKIFWLHISVHVWHSFWYLSWHNPDTASGIFSDSFSHIPSGIWQFLRNGNDKSSELLISRLLTYLLAYDNFCAMAMTNLLNYWYPAFSHIFWHMTISAQWQWQIFWTIDIPPSHISSDIWQFLRNGNDKSSELLISCLLTYLLAYDNFCAMAMTNLLNYWYPAFSHIRISIVQKICHCHCAEIVICQKICIWQFLRNGNDKSSELLISCLLTYLLLYDNFCAMAMTNLLNYWYPAFSHIRISIVQKICHCHCAEIVICQKICIWQFLRNGNDKSSELLISCLLTYLLTYDNFCAMAMTNLLNYWYPAFSHIFWHMTISAQWQWQIFWTIDIPPSHISGYQ